MKNFKKITLFFLFITIVFSCSSSNDSSGCETCAYTPTGGETDGSVPVALHGVHNLTLQYSQNGYKYADGKTAKFTITAKELTVEIDGEQCLLLKNPYTFNGNLNEFTFKDTCRDNQIYSVSIANNGGLNEINVGTLSQTFYGQFH
ncbi:MAG: hypothetical protein WAO74_01180 [Polaribacter sp.]|uniref:hypothetical protein n=1 Tax=Polaribacter sp. TaxID=1920175 RepID=UPI003BAE7BEC